MTVLDEQGLAALSGKLRDAIPPMQAAGWPDYLRATLTEAADTIDGVIAGTVAPDKVQGCVDAINAAFERHGQERIADADRLLGAAMESEDPDVWREALHATIDVMPPVVLDTLMDVFCMAAHGYDLEQAEQLAKMGVGGSC